MTFSTSKVRSCNNVKICLGVGLQICIPNMCYPNFMLETLLRTTKIS